MAWLAPAKLRPDTFSMCRQSTVVFALASWRLLLWAKVCEERQEVFEKYYTKGLAAMCAAAIRARGEQ